MTVETEVLWLDEHRVVSLTELVEVSGLPENELLELVNTGALPARDAPDGGLAFSARVVTMARTASRLRDDFELDTRGLAVALRLLERVRDLEGEIARLRAQLPRA
ncbi:MAG TPA: chaperone modulator CbpM [Steroidobacteraceae bacterium]|nr:chaperone modulator CbpM [Steroidobacteraceae bacterium]